jgi:SAM-dependent methyltransferase
MTAGSGGYPDDWAPYYEAHLSTFDRDDVDVYRERAKAADGPVLEMACGTGRIYLEVLRAGVDVDGFDASAGSVSLLRERAVEAGLEPAVWQADMRSFSVDREYDLVYCPFNAIQHLHGIDDQRAALEAGYDALAPGGTLLFDVFVPDFEVICGTYESWQTTTFTLEGAVHEHRSRSRIVDEVAQLVAVEQEVLDADGVRVAETSHRIKLLPKREVELLVRQSPFETWTVTGDFEGDPLAHGHTTQVWELERETT